MQALTGTSPSPLPTHALISLLAPSYAPCVEFGATCTTMRWNPDAGHIPRGWIGATGPLSEIRLVLVTAEPGDPGDGESYDRDDMLAMMGEITDLSQRALRDDHIRRNGRRPPFHRGLRKILNLFWPGKSLAEQLEKTWITPAVLCSAQVSGGKVAPSIERVCGTRYLLPQIRLLGSAYVVAVGNKAADRLNLLGRPADAFLYHPSARAKHAAKRTWVMGAEQFHTWLRSSTAVTVHT